METRRPAVAGQFYPGGARALRETVSSYVAESGVEPASGRVHALVSPHAGYIYSGPSAGYAFARVKGKTPGRVVVLGRSHRYHFDGASIFTEGAFETPLGNLPIDTSLATKLAAETQSANNEAHALEHAIEVQLPFIQIALGDVPIVPVLFGSDPTDWHAQLGESLAALLDENDLVIASTDLSHYLSEDQANLIDRFSLDQMLSKDWQALAGALERGTASMCGGTAVVVAMACALARGADAWRLLDYRTSAAASGDRERVVGYAAASMETGP